MAADDRLEQLNTQLKALAASTHDLRAKVQAQLTLERERNKRDHKYLAAIRDILTQWAREEGGK